MDKKKCIISLISNDEERIQHFITLLSDSVVNVLASSFVNDYSELLKDENPDLILIDVATQTQYNPQSLAKLREQKKYKNLPCIFIVSARQQAALSTLYTSPFNRILTEPLTAFQLSKEIEHLLYFASMESKVELYQNVVEGEKKLIAYMDDLLELSRLNKIENKSELISYLQTDFIKRLEMALAVEVGFYALYEEDKKELSIRFYSSDQKEIVKNISVSIKNSITVSLLESNSSHTFLEDELEDALILQLEAHFGYTISGLVFTPLVLLHKPLGAFVLINKLYRSEFTENDLAFATIAAQKIAYRLEGFELSKKSERRGFFFNRPIKNGQPDNNTLDKLFASVNFGFIIFDRDKNVIYSNKPGRDLLGKKKKAKNLSDLFEQNALDEITSALEVGTFPIVRQELWIERDNAKEYNIGYSIYTVDWELRNVNYIMVFSEISKTKKIQDEIVRMDKMASLGILSSGIAHEIRNPLAGIKAMAQNMEEELPENAHMLEYVKRILRQVERLSKLLKSFFSYAKPQRPDPKLTDVKPIVDEVLSLFAINLRKKNITVNEKYEADVARVFVDSDQIQQVLINIILNAIEAMEDGGKIAIEVFNSVTEVVPVIDKQKRPINTQSNNYVEIQITDNGIGFEKHVKNKIFNPFFTTKATGTGLGLAIVYQIIKEHAGHIEIESEYGKGATIKILLPSRQRIVPE